MKNLTKIFWGLVLLAIGVVLTLNALDITDIDIFFDGWWTLFIIVPCTAGLLKGNDIKGNLFGLFIGVYLLLCCLDILSFGLLWKLLIPLVILFIGLNLIFGGLAGKKGNDIIKKMRNVGKAPRSVFSAFSSEMVSFTGDHFEGAELTAVFGAIKCDLRGAVIEKDCAISFTSVFGGIDLIVPEGVNVKVNSTSIFGGTSNKTSKTPNAPTLYVSGLCMFGGVDVK